MEQQIEQLQVEIEHFQAQITKLQSELSDLSKPQSLPQSDSPDAIASAIRQAAQQTIERQPMIRGLQDAITELTARVNQKQAELNQLEQQQEAEQRRLRLEQGRAEVRAKIADIDDLARQMKAKFLQLKELEQQYGPDYRAQLTRSPFSGNRIDPLIAFHNLSLPELVEKNGAFVMQCRPVDMWAQEKLQQRGQWALNLSRIQTNAEQEVAAQRQRQAAERNAEERQRLENLLSVKQSELQSTQGTRLEWERQISRGVRLDTSRMNGYIHTLETEIQKIQSQLDGLKAEVA